MVLIPDPNDPETERDQDRRMADDSGCRRRTASGSRPGGRSWRRATSSVLAGGGRAARASGERARVEANLAALRLLRDLEREDRAPTVEEQRTLCGVVGLGRGARRV